MKLVDLVQGYYEYRGYVEPSLWEAYLWLVSEVGELGEALLQDDRHDWVRNNPDKALKDFMDVNSEIGDVLMMLTRVAHEMGVDPMEEMLANWKRKGYVPEEKEMSYVNVFIESASLAVAERIAEQRRLEEREVKIIASRLKIYDALKEIVDLGLEDEDGELVELNLHPWSANTFVVGTRNDRYFVGCDHSSFGFFWYTREDDRHCGYFDDVMREVAQKMGRAFFVKQEVPCGQNQSV